MVSVSRKSAATAAALLVVAGVVSSASAIVVPLDNPSFEAPAGPPYLQDAQTHPYGYIPGWAFQTDGGAAGQNDRDQLTYPNSYGDLPGGEGNTLGFINLGAPNLVNQAFTNVGTPFGYQPGYVMTLTVALGNPSGTGGENTYRTPGNYRLQFATQQQNTLLTSSDWVVGANLPDGALTDYTFQWVVPANFVVDPNNDAVRVQIQTLSTFAGQQSTFDNVRLDISVPEPTSLSVLGVAGLALARRRRA